jgi:hypothetical protein
MLSSCVFDETLSEKDASKVNIESVNNFHWQFEALLQLK